LGAIGRGDCSNCRAAQDDRRPRAARLTRLPTRTRNIRAAHRRDTLAPGARAPVGAIGVSRALESRKIAPHAIAWADAETDEIGLRTIAVHQTTTPAACRIAGLSRTAITIVGAFAIVPQGEHGWPGADGRCWRWRIRRHATGILSEQQVRACQ